MAQSSFETAAALQHLIQANLSVLYPSFKTEVVTLKDDGGLVSACVVGSQIDWERMGTGRIFKVLHLVRSDNSYVGTADSLEKLLHITQELLKENLGEEVIKYRQSSSYEPK
ncbi:hypothetical protein AU210_014705 [Fusarium oxysporum f. sp. radicis-cucumerinum]|uniref:Uncharacterized protein n=1 Tax=Fusarium oxysporum f. sp. radicis-cucumerinum TaxID=327505 RepID=A0A2H3GFC2_FUSOX|nr:hypothetical protein AU210_014705 [Fusarium oxysporum f. sp. radicis-cucumerinum]